MINIRPLKAVLHTGTWKGCGGNPNCKVDSKTYRKCSPTCQNCGKNSHWSCCSSRDEHGRFCLLGTSALQSADNSRKCRLGKGSAARCAPNLDEYEKHMSPSLLARMKIISNKKRSMPNQKFKYVSGSTINRGNNSVPLKTQLHLFDHIEMKESDFMVTSLCKDDANATDWAFRIYNRTEPQISCAGTSVTANVKAHGETVYFYKHAEAMKTLHKGGKSAKILAHRHHIAYSLANSKDIIKGHQAYIDSERGEHMRFTVINGNVPLYKRRISTSGFHKHRIRENTNSIEAFCIKPSLICKCI